MASYTFFTQFVKYLGDRLVMVYRMLRRNLRKTRKRKQTRKRKRKQTRKSRCRIAELPECILESILSLIPLTDAAATGLVCREWRSFLLKRRNLVFDTSDGWGNDEELLQKRVNTYLKLYKGNKVDSLRVKTAYCDSDVVDKWICFAIEKGVEELHLEQRDLYEYIFPHELLSKQAEAGSRVNLKYLSMSGYVRSIIRPPPDFNGFNQLVTLYLSEAIIHPCFTSNLFTIFPSLESLTLHSCSDGGLPRSIENLDIVAGDRLTELKVRDCCAKNIKISARSLAYLEYTGYKWSSSLSIKTPLLARINLSNLPFSTETPVDLDYCDPMSLLLLTRFAKCSELESICLRIKPTTLMRFSMPTFGNLRKLNVDIGPERWNYRSDRYDNDILLDFLNFLKAAPLLEELETALSIYQVFSDESDDTSDESDDEREIRNNVSGFTHDHLKLVKMKNFHCHWSEIEFVVCILNCARNLRIMEIGPIVEWRDSSLGYLLPKVYHPEILSCKQMLYDLIHFTFRENMEEVKMDAQFKLLS